MPAERNALLDGLPRSDRLRLLKHSEPVQLVLSQVLSEARSPQSTVLFPVNAFVSQVQQTRGQPGVEVGMVGREGMLGATLALDGRGAAPMRSVVLGPGLAWRMDAARFGRELRACEALRDRVRRYLFVTLVQLGGTSACHRFHPLVERLARWLLMSHDRARADEFEVTHARLGLTLGVRREGVTLAAGALQAAGVIRYRRAARCSSAIARRSSPGPARATPPTAASTGHTSAVDAARARDQTAVGAGGRRSYSFLTTA